jgi:AbrB family looped-hinge helix DNA binding protein
MTILATVKVSKGFRVTIPKEARKLLKLEEGDEIVFFTVEQILGRVCFRKAAK